LLIRKEMIQIPDIADKAKLFDWLIENKSLLIAQKKATVKHADTISYLCPVIDDKGEVVKADTVSADVSKIKVRSIINTTNLYDSHEDVHIPGLWNKSLKETKDNYLVNQHDFSFEGIITDNVHAFAKNIAWADLGYAGYDGVTQALVYDSIIVKEESPFMFEKYRTGKVKNHSVGMRYVKVYMAINDPRYDKEFEVWEKYFSMIVNPEVPEEKGYFFAVTEAKNIEGSAVVRGSNHITPTQSVSAAKSTDPIIEPDVSTHQDNNFIYNSNLY
jgi:hypothetical protein